ncbi:uncharacterized protein C8orf34 homolog isoform X2 [Babylonia areolata]|uniref:uncharacterized protein C8orf34 homolog isoform X2 n=1 Tax=Babylonia areolata TaxID=304850 RepID=UPI003FD26934
MAQGKMQAYMERHKLGPLFEDLMNRVLRDMPEEPLVYLLRTLYKKAGMEIPQDIRYGGLRKSVDLARSRSPERAIRSGHNTTDPTSTSASREYEKPWQTHQRRMKPRRSAEDAEAADPKTGKKRPEWQGDTKVLSTSFDELWAEKDGQPKDMPPPGKKSRPKNDPRSSWAVVGLESGDTFTSGEYLGPSRQSQRTEEELLAAETLRFSGRDTDSAEGSAQLASVSKGRGQRADSKRHRQQLESMLYHGQSSQNRGPVTREVTAEEADEALELLENAEDLQREGVKNIPATGYKLSKIMRERTNENVVKLNINLSPRGDGMRKIDSLQSFEGYESDRENVSPAGRWESEDEFESVSQVTGPRRPVWNVPDSDAESVVPHSRQKRHRTRQQGRQDLAATAPESLQQVTLTAGDLDLPANQTWSHGLNVQGEDSSPELERRTDITSARSGGWVVPDDSDAASVQDWNQRVKGKRRDPRSY